MLISTRTQHHIHLSLPAIKKPPNPSLILQLNLAAAQNQPRQKSVHPRLVPPNHPRLHPRHQQRLPQTYQHQHRILRNDQIFATHIIVSS
jgi:hypothetical protein